MTGSQTPEFKADIEGITVTWKTIPSPRNDLPYALQITVQSQAKIAPFAIGFVCDKAVIGFPYVVGGGMLSIPNQGPFGGPNPEMNYGIKILEGISPANPWVITLSAKEPFHVLKAVRLP